MVYPPIERGASLLVALSLASKTTLVVGGGALAATRATAALQADSTVLILVENDAEITSEEIIVRRDRKELEIVHFNNLEGFEHILQTLTQPVATAFITDTLIGTPRRRTYLSAATLRQSLSRRNILVNVADMPTLCDFTLPTCHRFPLSSSSSSKHLGSLQVAVTTNGKGCRLASRIRREVVSKLPSNIGDAVENVAKLRARVKSLEEIDKADELDGNEDSQPTTPNEAVDQGVKPGETSQERQLRRMRWVAQVSEYWPLEQLATMEPEKMDDLFKSEGPIENNNLTHHQLAISPSSQRGKIYLLGSGPGHPGLLTVAAHEILTRKATLVLSDKLVPAEVLALIPSSTPVKIAKKFPGNADGAQNELMVEAVEAASRGELVVRLKQGDPMVYGRAGEEVLYFRKHGFESILVPGITSAIAGPALANIPVTQRGVAESMILCTGVGRQGKSTALPGYIRSRTLVLLMGVARLDSVVETLISPTNTSGLREGAAYPSNLPIAIIERSSMPDQRVISATLSTISSAMAQVGEQRPPGMMVIGWSVLALEGEGDVDVLEDAKASLHDEEGLRKKDDERVQRWLGEAGWCIRERTGEWGF